MALTAAELMVRVGADTSEAERGLKSMGATVQNAGRAMTTTGLAMTAGITAPLMGIAAAALNSAADFEQSMNVLQQVTGASTGTMNEMTNAALKLGAETSFSAGEAADAMLELAKAGMETDEVLASIGGVMDLAAAGGIALADAANITANALNAFSLEASEADRVANLLAGGANASSADISDLSQGLAQAGFAFANANQPIENLVASLSLLTNVGLTGSDAGTALKNAFMRLMAPTKEARAVMKALNLEFYDASGQMKALPDMIGMMNEAFADMTPQQRDAALSTLFLSDGMKAMIPLLDAGTEGFNEMVDAVSAEGQATAVAGARMKGLRGAIEYLKGSVDSFLIGAARPFLDVIGDIIRQGADLLTGLGNLPPEITNMALAFAAVLAVAGPVALAIGGLISVFSTLNPIILAITVAVAALAAAWSSDFMGIQGATADALTTVSNLLTTVTEQANTFASAVSTAFSNTTFPTLEELWADFSAGDFTALTEKITSTAYNLMVNLDTELGISANATALGQTLVDAVNGVAGAVAAVDWAAKATEISTQMTTLRDNVYSSLTTAITAVPWTTVGTTIQTKIDELTTTINGLTLEGIDWKATFETILVAPVKLAIAGITWLFSGPDFVNFTNAVYTAIQDLGWAGIADSLAGLGTAIGTELGQLVIDMAADFGIKLGETPPDTTDAATKWGNQFRGDLILNTPDMSNAAGIWGTLFGNDLETESVDFATAATKFMNDASAEMAKTDYTPAGKAAGDQVANAIEFAFGAAEMAGNILTSISTWSNALGLSMRERIITGLQNGNLLSSINSWLTELDTSTDEFLTGMMTELQRRAGEWVLQLPELAIPKPEWMDQFFADAAAWSDTTKKSLDVWLSAAEAWQRSVETTLNTWMGAAETWASLVNENFTNWIAEANSWAETARNKFDIWLTSAETWQRAVETTLTNWMGTAQTWISDVGTTLDEWVNHAQAWILNVGATLTSWINRAIKWVADLLTAPPWVDTLIDFAANAPGWVSNLLDWTPSWLEDLLGFTIEIPSTPAAPVGEDAVPPSTIGMVSAAGMSFSRPSTSQPYYASAGAAAAINIGPVHIHNDMDVEVLAATIARRISQGGRR